MYTHVKYISLAALDDPLNVAAIRNKNRYMYVKLKNL
jgi:hypothetical protein